MRCRVALVKCSMLIAVSPLFKYFKRVVEVVWLSVQARMTSDRVLYADLVVYQCVSVLFSGSATLFFSGEVVIVNG